MAGFNPCNRMKLVEIAPPTRDKPLHCGASSGTIQPCGPVTDHFPKF